MEHIAIAASVNILMGIGMGYYLSAHRYSWREWRRIPKLLLLIFSGMVAGVIAALIVTAVFL